MAHSVTLALGILEVMQVWPAIVEPLIAASILYIAIENVVTDDLKPWRILVVLGFGLSHGFGFVEVLTEIGLSQAHFLAGLVDLNIGAELDQPTVIALCFLIVGLWFRSRRWYRRAVAIPASIAIGFVAAYWFAERMT